MLESRRLALLLVLAALPLGVGGCAPSTAPEDVDPDAALFSTGSDAEAAQAEDLAWSALDGMQEKLGLDATAGLDVRRVRLDDLGMAHVRYQQYADGVPVFGAEAIVHLNRDGSLRSLTDGLLRGLRVDTTPDLDADDATELALQAALGWETITADPVVDLWVLRHEGADHLVWRVQLERIDGGDEPTRPVLFVDAHSGDIVWQYENLQTDGPATGTGNGYYTSGLSFETYLSGSTYALEDATLGLGTFSYNGGRSTLSNVTDSDNSWTSSTTSAAVEAHYGAEMVFEYYYTSYGRDGIDGSGGPGLKSSLTGSGKVITSGVNYGKRYNNAFWDGSSMTYGDGDGSVLGPLTTVDIAGHEMTHGVTENESNLTYSGESGGLNECMSDIFGAAVEVYSRGGVDSDTWMVGEEAYTPSTSGDALRFMNDPAKDGASADFWTSSVASLDVHYSSGVGNLAFYLLSEGGTHPRGKSSTVVSGVGIDEAAAIWYRANTTYLISSSNYASARTATLNAATDLYGASSAEVTSVGQAWTAVGVAGSSGGGGSDGTCSGTSYSSTISSAKSYSYQPSSSGFTLSASGTLTASLSGPSSADFDLYLQKSGARGKWSNVATSGSATSSESITYSGTGGSTYRWAVYAYSGSGDYTLCTTGG